MAGNKAMITLQCGNYSNYIGAHFWNLQEAGFVYGGDGNKPGGQGQELLEVDNDVLYREGQTGRGEVTYTPRLVVMDLQGSLGLLPQCGSLYGRPSLPSTSSLPWTGDTQIFKEEPHRRNSFLREMDNGARENAASEKDIDICMDTREEGEGLYDLDDQVTFWSDYLGARFHPRSVLLATSFQHENTAHPFDMWGLGRSAWRGCDGVGEELEDRVRLFAEECDNLGGVQLLADWQDGFGGLASQVVELLSDEYSSKSLLVFPCSPSSYPGYSLEQGRGRLAGAALTLASSLPSSLTTPLSLCRDWFPLAGRSTSLPHCPYSPSLSYHSAAVLALALDTATLPYRRRHGASLTPADLAAGLNTYGRHLAVLAADLPCSVDATSPSDYLEADLLSHCTPLLPGTQGVVAAPAPSPQPYSALLTLRGLLAAPLYTRRSARFQPCPSAAAYLASCVNSSRRDARPVATYLFNRPISTSKPFPHIFSPLVDPCGTLTTEERPPGVGVSYTTQLTSWAAGPTAGVAAASLASQAGRLVLGKIHRLGESGVEAEEWQEAVERVRELASSYTEEDY